MEASWCEDKIIRVGFGLGLDDKDQIERLPVSKAEKREAWTKVRQGYAALDARKIIGDIAECGVEVAYFHAKSHAGNLWYPSKVGHTFSLLGKRDLFGELVAECRRRRIAPVGMVQITNDRFNWLYHPEWRIVGADGKRSYYLCLNQPRWRAYLLAVVAEIVASYDVAGICLDELRLAPSTGIKPGCYCAACRKLYRKECGTDLPKENWKDPEWARFLAWRYETVRRFLLEIRDTIKRIKPDVLLTLVSYTTSHNDYTAAQKIEFVNEALDYSNVDIARSVFQSETAKRFRVFSQHRPEIWTSGILPLEIPGRGAGDALCVKPEVEYLPEAMSIIANGAAMNMDTYQPPSRDTKHYFDSPLRQMIKTIAREVRRRKPWLLGRQEPVKYTALLHSERTRDFYASAKGGLGWYNNEFYGTYNALWQSQTLCEIIGEKQLRDDSLASFKVLVMPNAVYLSDEELEGIRRFVARGGGLVANYQTSLGDGQGQIRSDFGLKDLFGVSYEGGLERDFDFAIGGCIPQYRKRTAHMVEMPFDGLRLITTHPATARARLGGEEFLLPTPVLDVKQAGGKVLAYVTRHPAVAVAVSAVERKELTRNVAISVSNYGHGQCLWFNSKIGCLSGMNGHLFMKQMLVDAVRWAGGRPPIEVDAPFTVEMTAFRDLDKKRLIIHLINHQACPTAVADHCCYPTRRSAKEWLEARDIGITIRLNDLGLKFRKVYSAPEKSELKQKIKKNQLSLNIERLKLHQMIVMEFL